MAATTGTRPFSMRAIIVWPKALACCASAAVLNSRNWSMSAPAMNVPGLPESSTAAFTA